jgi:ferrous iron transport protein B
MAAQKTLRIALAGKPNAGKSSLFNLLTGLNQKIGNFPGITVDKRTGNCQLDADVMAQIMDLPGIYSLYPRTLDEKIVTDILSDKSGINYPDCVVLVADATNLKNCMLLLTQLIDLQIPTVLALNMMDLAARSGQSIDVQALSVALDLPVVMINASHRTRCVELKKLLTTSIKPSSKTIYKVGEEIEPLVKDIQQKFNWAPGIRPISFCNKPITCHFLLRPIKLTSPLRQKLQIFFSINTKVPKP